MADYSNALGAPRPGFDERDWHLLLNAQLDLLAGMGALTALLVTLPAAERPTSASLDVYVNPGMYLKADRTEAVFAGATLTIAADNAINYVWLDAAGAPQQSTTGYPAAGTAHAPLATVTAASGAIASIVDDRIGLVVGNRALGLDYLALTVDDSGGAVGVDTGATNGLKLGTAATQKLGFWGATPVVRPASASQAAVTMASVGATNSSDVSATINANFTALATLVNQLRADLVTVGAIKGSA